MINTANQQRRVNILVFVSGRTRSTVPPLVASVNRRKPCIQDTILMMYYISYIRFVIIHVCGSSLHLILRSYLLIFMKGSTSITRTFDCELARQNNIVDIRLQTSSIEQYSGNPYFKSLYFFVGPKTFLGPGNTLSRPWKQIFRAGPPHKPPLVIHFQGRFGAWTAPENRFPGAAHAVARPWKSIFRGG